MRIVYLEAVDWAMYEPQVSENFEFDLIRGCIVGFLVRETDEMVILTQQWFAQEEQIRRVICVPKVCITKRKDVDCE